jgi:CubicO group peptidase (beta-lactamase class C family)
MQSPPEMPIIAGVQTPERMEPPFERGGDVGLGPPVPAGLWGAGERLTWLSGLVLMLSAFMSWYAGSGDGLTIGVIGWHTGFSGKLVFFVGLAVLALVVLREAGIELPAAVPESLVVIVLGAVATVVTLYRTLSIPERFLPADGRSIGLWISLIAAIAVIVAGLLRAAEEL